MRVAAGKRLADRVSVVKLSAMTQIETVNRMAAEALLMTVWQGLHDPNSPLSNEFMVVGEAEGKTTRARIRGDLKTSAKTTMGQRNFPHTAIQLWNHESNKSLRETSTKYAAKKKIKHLASLLPP